MNNVNEQHTTSGAVRIPYQRQKRVLSSSEPNFAKSESKPDSRSMVHAFTLHLPPKGTIKAPSMPISPNDAASTEITE